MPAFYPTISHLSLDSFGLSETIYEPKEDFLVYVLCDAICITNPSESLKISKIFEKNVREYIHLHRNEIGEKLFKKAIEHAQNYFYKNYLSFENQLKVSLVIIAQEPNVKQGPYAGKILISGVGDIKVYHLDHSLQLIYYDSEIPHLPENLSLKKRFNYITNALGTPDIKCKITSSELNQNSSLLIATYGSYHQTNKEKLFAIFSDFENKKNQVNRLIQRSREKDHLKSFSLITFHHQTLPENQKKIEATHLKENNKVIQDEKKERYFPMWAVKIALVALVCLICLEFFNYYISTMKTSPYGPSLKNTPKEVEANLSLKSIKKPLEFPFLKERAYIIDLKEKYERQSEVIEKLQDIISEQDKALRNLQVKSYYQPDTISAKSFRSEEKTFLDSQLSQENGQ